MVPGHVKVTSLRALMQLYDPVFSIPLRGVTCYEHSESNHTGRITYTNQS